MSTKLLSSWRMILSYSLIENGAENLLAPRCIALAHWRSLQGGLDYNHVGLAHTGKWAERQTWDKKDMENWPRSEMGENG